MDHMPRDIIATYCTEFYGVLCMLCVVCCMAWPVYCADFIANYRTKDGDFYVASVPLENMHLRADVPNLEAIPIPIHRTA